MPTTGFKRYYRLSQNVKNPIDYFLFKWKISKQPLTITTKPNRITFPVLPEIYLVFKEVFMSDVYDIEKLVKSLPKNPLIIDVGANVGLFDIIVLSKLPDAVIIAYEPIEQNTNFFTELIQLNPLLKNVKFNRMAVTGTKVDSIDLYAENTDKNQIVASVIDGFSSSNTMKIKVPAISLSEIIHSVKDKIIDVLKLDCEGSEYDIVYNTPKECFNKVKTMLIEVHTIDKDKKNIDFFSKYLESLNFEVQFSPINGFCYALEAHNRNL
jgi:FkbM family methyltransferase